MSDFLQWEVNGRFLQLPKRNYKVIAEFKPPIHDIPVSEVEYQVIKNLVDAAPDLLEVAEAVKTMFKIMHDKGSIHSIVCSGDVKKVLVKLEQITAKVKGGTNEGNGYE